MDGNKGYARRWQFSFSFRAPLCFTYSSCELPVVCFNPRKWGFSGTSKTLKAGRLYHSFLSFSAYDLCYLGGNLASGFIFVRTGGLFHLLHY